MVTYDSAALYIESQTTTAGRIAAIDSIIDALMVTAATAAGSDNITEYSLNDGQTQIKTIYKGADSVLKSIAAFERLKQMYINKLNGRVFRLVDSKSF